MMANWLIKAILEKNPASKFNTEIDKKIAAPMRAFEAALFMMGDDLTKTTEKLKDF
jgi:hypothetical protein